MRKIRHLSFFLVLILLCGVLPLFAACSKADAQIVESAKTVEIDISDITVVYEESGSNTKTLPNLTLTLASRLTALGGASVKASTMERTATAEGDKELLVGKTSREESTKAYKAIKGDGFQIVASKNKIVIVGSSVLFTIYALQYFMDTYLESADGSVLTLPAKVTLNKARMATLATSEGCDFTFVYSEELNPTRLHADPDFQGIYGACDNRDYPVVAAQDIADRIASATGLRRKNVKDKNDSKEAEGAEFTFGILNREASTALLNTLEGDEFIFRAQEGAYCITAWNDAGLVEAHDTVVDLLSLATVTDEAGAVTIAFPDGFEISGAVKSNWIMDFPKPQGEGISLFNTLDTNTGCLQFLYSGSGVNAEAYAAYCDTLKKEGYRVITENSIEGSCFTTLVNDAKKTMLYVAYDAYSHQGEFAHEFMECFRIVSGSTDKLTVPDAEILSPNTAYEKKTNSAVTAIAVPEGAVGLAYVVTLEDGSFVVFDGGASGPALLWNVLSSLNARISGQPTSASNPVRVSAWVITHSHADHYSVAMSIISTRIASKEMTMGYLLGNYPSATSLYPIQNNDIMTMSDSAIFGLAGKNNENFKFLKVHTGERYYFANLEIEIMMTYDDHNPHRINNTNDTNTVLRFSFFSKDDPSADPYTALWLGDANKHQSRFMCAMYGDYLKSNMVQVAHHGNIGCEHDLYDSVNAEAVLFPNTLKAFQSYMTGGRGWWVNDVDQALVFDNPNTDYVFVSALAHTTIPIRSDGTADYEAIYDAIDGKPVEYEENINPGGAAIKIPAHPGEE